MLNYSNFVSCSVSENKNEFILIFRQLAPVLDAEGKFIESAANTLSEIVMNRDTAVALSKLLNDAVSTLQVVGQGNPLQ